jgi:SAM-dependent methyltransferase
MRYSNLEIYSDPTNYDLESGVPEIETSVLWEHAAQASGPVLELGCGTGRITIPLARRGIAMTGLDVLPHMIDHAKRKSAGLPISWVCDDVCDFQLETRFSLVFTWGGVLQHLLHRTEQEAMLARVREHLAPGGRFIVDAFFKHPESMVDDLEEEGWFSYIDQEGREVLVSGMDRYSHLTQIWRQIMYRRWIEDGEPQSVGPINLDLRYFMPQELESLLHFCGFTVQSRYGSWEGSPLTEDSHSQIYVCSLR